MTFRQLWQSTSVTPEIRLPANRADHPPAQSLHLIEIVFAIGVQEVILVRTPFMGRCVVKHHQSASSSSSSESASVGVQSWGRTLTSWGTSWPAYFANSSGV